MNSARSQELSLLDKAMNYEPKTIKVDIDLVGVNSEMGLEDNLEASYIIVLKQSLYHMQCCNQSYNLLSLFDGDTEYILDLVLKDMKIDRAIYELDGLSSLRPYHFFRKGESSIKNDEINRLVGLIKIERDRIKKLYEN